MLPKFLIYKGCCAILMKHAVTNGNMDIFEYVLWLTNKNQIAATEILEELDRALDDPEFQLAPLEYFVRKLEALG